MISLTFTVGNINAVMYIYDRIQVMRYNGTSPAPRPVDIADYITISGVDTINSRTGVSDVLLNLNYTEYYFQDAGGDADDWYVSRYYNDADASASAWTNPILGESQDVYYDPLYPPEIEYGSEDQLIINRIRRLIGDPLGLRREYGEEAASSIHPDNKTYELDEKGWPATIYMNNTQYNNISNPSVNGYKFLRFDKDISITTTISGMTYGVDIYYYTFRHSDREIMDAYDNCPPPVGLTTVTATSEAYMLQTAYELLYSEVFEDSGEDGAIIRDEGTLYNPEPGQQTRRALLENLKKRLDDLVKSLMLGGVEGVLID